MIVLELCVAKRVKQTGVMSDALPPHSIARSGKQLRIHSTRRDVVRAAEG